MDSLSFQQAKFDHLVSIFAEMAAILVKTYFQLQRRFKVKYHPPALYDGGDRIPRQSVNRSTTYCVIITFDLLSHDAINQIVFHFRSCKGEKLC